MGLHTGELRARLEPLFQENFEKFGELGAAVSVWQNGEPIVDLHGGFKDARREKPWNADTLVLIWSATKGLGSACVLHVLQEHKIDIEQRVSEFWPQFAKADKEKITLAQLLSHQAGLAVLDRRVDVLDYEAVIHALEHQQPNWPPGTAHGYHTRTFGFLLDELVRRIARIPLGDYWRKTFAEPLGLDLWIGLPEKENPRVATTYAAKRGRPREPAEFYRDLATPGTFARKAFTSPVGLHTVSMMNKPALRAHPIVSLGGIGSANSLAKFYAMLADSGHMQDRQFFTTKTLSWMKTTLSDGIDRVFQIPTAFSTVFMKDSCLARANLAGLTSQVVERHIFGKSRAAFGQPGAGGSHAFTDPENKIGFAYVMNQMEQSVLPNEKSLRLVDAIYR